MTMTTVEPMEAAVLPPVTQAEMERRYGPTRPLDGALEHITELGNRIDKALVLMARFEKVSASYKVPFDEITWVLTHDA